MFIFMQAKLIFTQNILHEDSLRRRGKRQQGSGISNLAPGVSHLLPHGLARSRGR